MTHRSINGLTYDIISPSHWQLSGYPVELSFLGDAWFLSLVEGQDVKMLKLNTREHGLMMIEQAFERNRHAQ